MDMAGVLFARGEFEWCEALLDSTPAASDFRGDLYRMWMAEARGDPEGALRLMVTPERGGNATTAVGQIHAAAAGVLFRAGRQDAARQAMDEWARVERRWDEDMLYEAPAMRECLLALADVDLLNKLRHAFEGRDERIKVPARFTTLQGRALAPLRAGIAARLGLREEAERVYRDGVAWCERERCVADAALCRTGLEQIETASER
jgi:hypothetical protein